MSDAVVVLDSVKRIAREFANQRRQRQLRHELDPKDFAALREAGFLLTGVPAEQGGLWFDLARSTRPIAEILRTLARGDSSVALVSAMHPAVLSFWLSTPAVPSPHADAWLAQRTLVADHALAGNWWGTITSEPGSGVRKKNSRMSTGSSRLMISISRRIDAFVSAGKPRIYPA